MKNPFSQNDKRIVVFTKNISGIDTVIGKRKVQSGTVNIKFRKALYPVSISIPTYRERNVFIYLIDVEYGQLSFAANEKLKIPLEIMDEIFSNQIIKQLVSTMNKTNSMSGLPLALALMGMGLAIGYIIGNFIPMGN